MCVKYCYHDRGNNKDHNYNRLSKNNVNYSKVQVVGYPLSLEHSPNIFHRGCSRMI